MNQQLAASSAKAFFLASRRCLEEREVGRDKLEMILVPGIVCAVFSIELGFKALLLRNGQKTHGHRLADLFGRLGPWLQNELIQGVKMERKDFIAALEEMSDAFVEWRYVYERVDARMNMAFLERLAEATTNQCNLRENNE